MHTQRVRSWRYVVNTIFVLLALLISLNTYASDPVKAPAPFDPVGQCKSIISNAAGGNQLDDKVLSKFCGKYKSYSQDDLANDSFMKYVQKYQKPSYNDCMRHCLTGPPDEMAVCPAVCCGLSSSCPG